MKVITLVVNVVGVMYSETVRMTNDYPDFMDDYARGMEMLQLASNTFATFAGGLGIPVGNPAIPTAQVSLNADDRRILFEMNPDFIHKLKDSEVAAVIAHESYHVMLDHLSEIVDTKRYPKYEALVTAQECIINDGLPGRIGFEVPEGGFRGIPMFDQDFSLFSTEEGYNFILKRLEEEQNKQDQSKDNSGDDSESDDSSDDKNSGQGGVSNNKTDEANSDDSNDEAKNDTSDDENSNQGNQSGKGSDESSSDDSDKTGSGDDNDSNTEGNSTGNDSRDAGDDTDGSSQGSGSGGACHGVKIVGNNVDSLSDDELRNLVREVMGEVIDDALKSVDVDSLPSNVLDALENLEADANVQLPSLGDTSNKGFSLGESKNGFNTIDSLSGMSMNWVNLLAKINPRVKSSGKPKAKDAWHAPRRRMLHSYPQVILPTTRRIDDANKKKGDSVPTFILALDMSPSIPTSLLKDLASLGASLPEKLIKGYPITWSTNYRVFDPERPREICPRSGTNVGAVIEYAEKIEQETGTAPYVLVITDGEFTMPARSNVEKMTTKWFWMGLNSSDVKRLERTVGRYLGPNNVFNMKDFV